VCGLFTQEKNMNRTKWFVMPLLMSALAGWASAQGQANQAQPQPAPGARDSNAGAQIEIDVQEEEIIRDRDVTITQQPDTDRPAQQDDAELRRWAGQEPAAARDRLADRPAATRPADAEGGQARREAGVIVQDPDIVIIERGERPLGYWSPSREVRAGEEVFLPFRDSPPQIDPQELHQMQAGQYERLPSGSFEYRDMDSFYGYRSQMDRDRGVYGYESGQPAAPSASGVQGAVIHPVPSDSDRHNWWRGKNLVDDNFIQTQDRFEVDRDFYTKEWKVAQPPLVQHPRFHTIYDNELTQRYYTPWHGSPVLWSANAMTPTPMPQTRNQLLSRRQMVTFWTGWDEGNISNTPMVFGGRTGSYAYDTMDGRMGSQDVYGYRSGELAPQARPSDGTFRMGGQTYYWDDQDLLESGTGMGATYETFGFVAPEAQTGPAFGAVGTEPDSVYLNIPRSYDVNIYGVPSDTGR